MHNPNNQDLSTREKNILYTILNGNIPTENMKERLMQAVKDSNPIYKEIILFLVENRKYDESKFLKKYGEFLNAKYFSSKPFV